MNMPRAAALYALSLLMACTSDSGPGVDTARILAADAEPGSWLSHGRDYAEQRFSPLSQIDAETVGGLGLAWTYELATDRGASGTPLVVDGVMYVTSAWSVVYALDARTGAPIWVYDPGVQRSVGAKACCDVTNRGVAAYDGKIFVGVTDGRLVALSASRGSVVWETMTVDPSLPYTITGAPRAANGLVYIGNGGAEYGVRGYVSAYDAATGALTWRFYTVPGDPAAGPDGAASDPVMAMAAETWTGTWWTLGGGGTVWDAIVYDADFDQLIIGVGNGSPWNHRIRSPGGGDNLFLSSIVALDARSGAYRWHYQTTPGESWDFTATQPIILADLQIDGADRKVAMQAPKNGFFYVLDRESGELISAGALVPMVPSEDTPPGFPISWARGIDMATGRPIENPGVRYAEAPAVVHPSPFGAHNWHPMSYSPQTGLVYIPVLNMAFGWVADPDYVERQGWWNQGIILPPLPDDASQRAAILASAQGSLVAWNPVTQEAAWTVELDGPWNGGTLATAGNLVFQGTSSGHFRAYDAASKDRLWDFDAQAAVLAGPVTYELDGEQYVTVLAGYGSAFYLIAPVFLPETGTSMNGRVYTFKLGGTAPPPRIDRPAVAEPRSPEIASTPAQVEAGAILYGRFCAVCHGMVAVSGGVVPDLRRSELLDDPSRWAQVSVEGSLSHVGMPEFGPYLAPAETELIRAYVATQAALSSR